MSDYFSEKAKAWDAQPMREAMAQAFIAELARLAPAGPGTDALEFGAGTGLIGLKLARACAPWPCSTPRRPC